MKPFGEMSVVEFTRLQRRAGAGPYRAFPRFCQDTAGYEFYRKQRRLWKWELFDMGYRDPGRLVKNETDIIAVVVTEPDLI